MYLVRIHPTYRWSAAMIAGIEFVKHQARAFAEISEELQHAADVGILEITEAVVQEADAKSGENGTQLSAATGDRGIIAQPELPVPTSKSRRKKG